MATEGSVMSPGTLGSGNYDEFERDFEALLREQHQTGLDRERELNLYRSGSAPPTVEGARAARIAAGDGVVSEEEMRAHPAYLSYYYSNENLNPRLPHPKVSREDWRVARRFSTAVGEVGDQRGRRDPWEGGRGGSGSSSSLFSFQPGITVPNGEEMERLQRQSPSRLPHSPEWLERSSDGLIGLGDVRLGARRKSMTDTMQEDFVRPNSLSGHVSRPVSRNAFNTAVDPIGVSDAQLAQLHNDMESVDNMYSGATSNGLVRVQSFGSTMSHSFASAVGSSMARSTTPDPQLVRRSPSPCLPTLGGGRVSDADKKILSNGFTGSSSGDDMASALSGLKLTDKITEDLLFNMPSINVAQTEPSSSTVPLRAYNDFTKSTSTSNGQINLPKRLPSADGFRKGAIGSTSFARSSGHYQTDRASIDFGGRDSNTYSPNHSDAGTDGQYFSRIGNQVGSDFQVPINDPLYAQYLQRASDSAAQAPGSLSDPSLARNYLGNSLMDLPPGYQEAYLAALLGQQKLHYGSPFLGKSGSFNNGLYHNPTFGLGLPYPNQLSGSVLSSLGSPIRQNDRISRIPSMSRSASGGSKGSWNHENGIEEGFTLSLLEELKSNKTRSFELSEIVGHVVEFSGDQYGSRFIQQKLETGSVEEKNSIFPEILPHARVLMTDVFGNYVIQKFFEHGTESQRNQLADQLMGYVLPLSLQMYGCRVIQKALEVVDVDQQTQMVAELDGSVMKCVRDQNGNHVIQKCIECVPQERIQFIVSSFYGQVVALSTHPYGCRVIQRVLEHCDDAQTQGIMMQEILQSVSTLAQDQYGNYVVQHVLQHGKPEERSAIISKLTGQIVKMSQQKFASNVVEKCLTYGTPEERLLLIDEMLGTTDENEPLQAMMKDQFGNYVVQKVLETCDDQKLELIISRIKAHLNALKKYTYGKHIVARVEKLIATGERRIGMAANSA